MEEGPEVQQLDVQQLELQQLEVQQLEVQQLKVQQLRLQQHQRIFLMMGANSSDVHEKFSAAYLIYATKGVSVFLSLSDSMCLS